MDNLMACNNCIEDSNKFRINGIPYFVWANGVDIIDYQQEVGSSEELMAGGNITTDTFLIVGHDAYDVTLEVNTSQYQDLRALNGTDVFVESDYNILPMEGTFYMKVSTISPEQSSFTVKINLRPQPYDILIS